MSKPTQKPNLSVWKRMKLGRHKTKENLKKALNVKGLRAAQNWALDLIDSQEFNIISPPKNVNHYKETVSILGFPNGGKYSEIIGKVREMGYMECPCGSGPKARLAFPDQNPGPVPMLLMDPIKDSDGNKRVFTLFKSDALCLATEVCDEDTFIRPEREVIFCEMF